MNKTIVLTGFVASLLFVSLIAYSLPAFAQNSDSEKSEIIAVTGKVPGKDLIVNILIEVPPGSNRSEIAISALAEQGARPFTSEEFTLTGLVWDQFDDSILDNDSVLQNYNSQNDPTGGEGKTALQNSQNTWNNVPSSIFTFTYGETTRCPSLVKECQGPQEFDGYNDVAWMRINSPGVLGVTWSGSSTDEADIAMNTKFSWSTDTVLGDVDIETVFLHENGHAAGIGHEEIEESIMAPRYDGLNRDLKQDDIDAITTLYPPVISSGDSPIVTITSPVDGATFTMDDFITFSATATDTEDIDLVSALVWTSDIDGVIDTSNGPVDSLTNAIHTITASVIDSDGNSANDSVTITVGTITAPTESSIPQINYSLAGGKSGDKHLLFALTVVDNLGVDVSGADVSIRISSDTSKFDWVGTLTTGTTGDVVFQLSNARSGCYTTVVTSVDSVPEWDNNQPVDGELDSGFCKP